MEEKYMLEALQLAQEALDAGEVPVGCVFVKGSDIVTSGRNNTNASMNATRHAELEAIDRIVSGVDKDYWADVDVYVTVEPCIMCATALGLVGIRHVYFGCANDKFGGCGTVLSVHNSAQLLSKGYTVTGGIMRQEAIMMLRKFYVRQNDHGSLINAAPVPRKKQNRVLKPVDA